MAKKSYEGLGVSLVRKYGTRDPFAIAEELGIRVIFCPDIAPLKGMYRVIKRVRFIFIDSTLSEPMQRIVCAHEIGHDRLHRFLAQSDGIREFMLYDMRSTAEYEANCVAADILLDETEILSYARDYRYTAEMTAKAMHTDVNLVALKISNMAKAGVDLRPADFRNNFLK